MRIHINRQRCEGHGQCAATSEGVLYLDENAEPVLYSDGYVPPHLEQAARAAVSCCPVAALSAEEE
ncbi:ferredoxin [Nocardia carnea]|uniref:ferredoxin n=1 Tax=Nocardia carnea TaxID=37328 RepID=UPI002453E6C6|nr:ferredoxin [Nocardia carnea]